LIQAVDKFEPPYKYVFGVTATYRMTGNMMEETSSTQLKFSPKERRIINRARRAVTKGNAQNDEEVGNYVRESFDGTSTKKIKELVDATSSVHSYDVLNPITGTPRSEMMVSQDESPEDSAERSLNMVKLDKSMESLTILQRKVIKLKVGG